MSCAETRPSRARAYDGGRRRRGDIQARRVAFGHHHALDLADRRAGRLRPVRRRGQFVQPRSAAPAVGPVRRLCVRAGRPRGPGRPVTGKPRRRRRTRRDALRRHLVPAAVDGRPRPRGTRGRRRGHLRHDAHQAWHPVPKLAGAGQHHQPEPVQPIPAADGGVRHTAGAVRPQPGHRSADLVRHRVPRGVRLRAADRRGQGQPAVGPAADGLADHRVRTVRRRHRRADGRVPVPRLCAALADAADQPGPRRAGAGHCLIDEGDRVARACGGVRAALRA